MALHAERSTVLVFREEPADNQLKHPAPQELYTRHNEIQARQEVSTHSKGIHKDQQCEVVRDTRRGLHSAGLEGWRGRWWGGQPAEC